ncbi:MAG: hypothetical protein JO001_06650 [Alphaproteobacteria bacterium]|nr:hypothetical protein [Alphaproteobacteria bacterium]
MEPANADQMHHRQVEKDTALADMAAVLHQIEVEKRDPDRWERVHLVQAFAAIFSGCYTLASVEARSALAPVSERSPRANLAHDPVIEQCDLPTLMRVWQAAKADPVEQFAHFGPVVLKGIVPKNPGKSWLS